MCVRGRGDRLEWEQERTSGEGGENIQSQIFKRYN